MIFVFYYFLKSKLNCSIILLICLLSILFNQHVIETTLLDYDIDSLNSFDQSVNHNHHNEESAILEQDLRMKQANSQSGDTQREYSNPNEYKYESDCYDKTTRAAKRCMPEFINAAFGLKIIASNTCGQTHPSEYCLQTNLHNFYFSKTNNLNPNNFEGISQSNNNDFLSRVNPRCRKCDANDVRYAHSPEHLNDYNNPNNLTWWQSETMLEGVQYPNSVNLTLHLGKSFDINYIQIRFHSPRPESFAIYKRTVENGPWTPYQYYSASCRETYGVSPTQIVTYENEAIALCTDEFSDIAPLTGASVVFGTLEDRPSAYDFENSEQLKEWVTATDIRITLNRLNTFGDEVFNDPQVLKSYYYAISDIAVGGRCKCNGHASRCEFVQQHDFEDRLTCNCEHNTGGVDCGECLPFYNDVPWAPATLINAHECKPCFCNGLSQKCHFNQTLFDMTGHGGYCDDCEGNTSGPHCDECKYGHYRRENEVSCIDCQCNPFGSESTQCDPSGKCRCRPGVVGEKCDHCAPYHYDLSITGCTMCNCSLIGSFDSPPVCDPRDGACRCKANVEGKNCDRPKPGFFNLAEENLHGALPCFCFAHTNECTSSSNHFIYNISTNYELNKWKMIDSSGVIKSLEANQYNQEDSSVSLFVGNSQNDVWFMLPDRFLGDRKLSYNQELSFELQIYETEARGSSVARPSRKDVILESAQFGLQVYLPIYGGSGVGSSSSSNSQAYNTLPSTEPKIFKFKLTEFSGWMPTISVADFQRLLTNISAIKIRASYSPMTHVVLRKLSLTSAKPFAEKTPADEIGVDSFGKAYKKQLKEAAFVEMCKCPVGHIGQHCENCAIGYRRDTINGGPFARCVPCACNNHSLTCDVNTGVCDCQHHTTGDNCEKCEHGYYGSSILPTQSRFSPDDSPYYNGIITEADLANMCKKCPCPNNGPCAEIFNYQLQSIEVVCLECPLGTQGNLCELCDDGYYNSGVTSNCEKCVCNGNIDENSVGNCDSQAPFERCLRCIYNTTGDQCENCLPNYWGNPLSTLKCRACNCFKPGTYENGLDNEPKQCNLNDGQCECKPNVINRECDKCKEGYWNILSGKGCEECKCNPLGSYNLSCDALTGQCFCRPGVQGLKCDTCKPLYFGFSDEGCKKCECDPVGTQKDGFQCDDFGKCKCKENFAGLKCNQCMENRYNYTSGCLKCDDCYDLVQKQVNVLREKIKNLELTTDAIVAENNSPQTANNDETKRLLEKLNTIKQLIDDFHKSLFVKQNLKGTYKDTIAYFQDETARLSEAVKSMDKSFEQFNVVFRKAENLYNQVQNTVGQAQTQLGFIANKNEKRADDLDTIKQGRLDHDQNVKLQNLAKQSREASENHKKLAEKIDQELRKNLNDAVNAIKDLKDILKQYEQLEQEKNAEQLIVNYEKLRDKANFLISEAITQKSVLDKGLNDAEELVEKIKNYKIPEQYNIKNIEKESEELASNFNEMSLKTSAIKKNIDELKNKFDKFSTKDSLSAIGFAQTQLNTAKLRQKDIDYLYNIAEKARNNSESASKMANEVFANASKILQTLENFDEIVSKGKQKLDGVESAKNLTQANLDQVQEALRDFDQKLFDLNSKIEDIKGVSYGLNLTISDAQSSLDKLLENATKLSGSSDDLKNKTDKLITHFETNSKPRSNEVLSLYSNLNNRSDLILKQAEQVANGTQKLLDNAYNALESLERINKSISNFKVSNLKKADVIRLKQKFEKLSFDLDNNSQIDDSISNLEKSTKYLLNTAKQYKFQIEHLKKQVDNLEMINNSLERKCFANTIAKPEL